MLAANVESGKQSTSEWPTDASNDAPTAVTQAATATEDEPLVITLVGNDVVPRVRSYTQSRQAWWLAFKPSSRN